MSILDRIKRGNSNLPNRFVIAGPMGIGKTTLASKAPNPVFVCAEDGLTGFDHVPRFAIDSIPELHEFLDAIPTTGHKTVVIDTSDFLERIIAAGICKTNQVTSIEEVGGGWGKGYTAVEEEMVKIIAKLDQLRGKGIGSIILAHTHTKAYTNPEGVSYDRYELKGNKKTTGLLCEWADAVLFCTHEVFKVKEKGARQEKAIGGERVMHTSFSPAWDAKNRLNLPETLPLEWDALEQAIKENSPESLRAQVQKLFTTAKLDEKGKASWTKWLTGIDGISADKLKQAIVKLTEKQ